MLLFRKQLSLLQKHSLMKSYDNPSTRMDSLLCQIMYYFTHGHHLTLLNYNPQITTHHQLRADLSMQQDVTAVRRAVCTAIKVAEHNVISSKLHAVHHFASAGAN